MKNILILVLFLLSFVSCKREDGRQCKVPEGKLFIIGGGQRPEAMLKRLIQEANLEKGGYIIVLPMASEEPDTAAFYGTRQFKEAGIINVSALHYKVGVKYNNSFIDSVENAALIYISGGDQVNFMKAVLNTPLYEAMHKAYCNGAVIAGTSAGAAVMSRKMITGNERKHPEYTGEYRSIEADNIIIAEGMGFVDNLIVDQHFIKRMRMNRLIATAIENPSEICIGIDESTAILIKRDSVEVIGESQIIVLHSKGNQKKLQKGLLGAKNMSLDVYLPGQKFILK